MWKCRYRLIYIKHRECFKYSKIETHSETSKSGDRSLAIPVELPTYLEEHKLTWVMRCPNCNVYLYYIKDNSFWLPIFHLKCQKASSISQSQETFKYKSYTFKIQWYRRFLFYYFQKSITRYAWQTILCTSRFFTITINSGILMVLRNIPNLKYTLLTKKFFQASCLQRRSIKRKVMDAGKHYDILFILRWLNKVLMHLSVNYEMISYLYLEQMWNLVNYQQNTYKNRL